MTNPRLAYAGNRRIGVRGLEILLEQDWRPAVLILPAGDNAEFTEEMKALAPGVPVLEGEDFRTREVVDTLASLELDYILSVHFPYVIPPAVLELPRVGSLNLHPAYLPFNRGWHTPTWAILDETPYGATLHWIDEGIDTGDIALRRKIDVRPDDTAHRLYQRVLRLEEELLREALPLLLERKLPRVPQEPGGTGHRKEEIRAVQRLDPSERKTVGEVIRLLRALTTNDWGEAAYFEVDGVRHRVRVEIRPEESA